MSGATNAGEYVAKLEAWLRAQANPEAAGPMAAYMKGKFPFLGLRSPERVELTRRFLAGNGFPADAEDAAARLWELPEREFQYTALFLLDKDRKRAPRTRIALYERLILEKSWWDTADLLAAKLAGSLLARFPDLIPERAEAWIASDNLWLRRTAILFQLGYKGKTDAELLFEAIRRNADDPDFFIRKAIGWALREYAKTDPRAVAAFAESNRLSPLSAREALKRIGKPG